MSTINPWYTLVRTFPMIRKIYFIFTPYDYFKIKEILEKVDFNSISLYELEENYLKESSIHGTYVRLFYLLHSNGYSIDMKWREFPFYV